MNAGTGRTREDHRHHTSRRAPHDVFRCKQLSTAVFIGVPTGAALGDDREDLTIGDVYVDGPLYGSSLAAPTWKRIMDVASAGMEVQDWEEPSE